jgi:D-alanyl-D-alanine carboxypeptidase
MRSFNIILFWCFAAATSPAFADPALDALVAAYPDQLVSHDDGTVTWQDGTVMPVGGRTQRSLAELLRAPSILDQFAIPYPLGTNFKIPRPDQDPGRIRNEAFFTKMYGDCRSGGVEARLQPVAWMPHDGGGTLLATSVNGVAGRLAAISRALETLPKSMIKFLVPSAGAYQCRTIAGTDRPSVHSYGAAIDINVRFSDYWRWTLRKTGQFTWTNRIPLAIVDIFERHGFIWGGKWFHFDTMHFEYRPAMIALAAKRAPPR